MDKKNSWWSDLSNIIQVVLMLAIAFGGAMLAWLQSLPYYVIYLSALGSLCLGLIIYNQFKISRDIFRRRNLGKYIQDILYNAGYSCTKQDLKTAIFCIIAESGHRKTTIMQTKSKPGTLDIFARLEMGDYIESIDKITSKADSTLLFDLTIEMARFGVIYSEFTHPLRTINLSTTLPIIKFTALDLLDRVEKVHRAIILAKMLIDKEIAQANLPSIPDKPSSQSQ